MSIEYKRAACSRDVTKGGFLVSPIKNRRHWPKHGETFQQRPTVPVIGRHVDAKKNVPCLPGNTQDHQM